MMMPKPESKKCSGCGFMHPSPWDDKCPMKAGSDKQMSDVIMFSEFVKTELPKYSNTKELIAAMTKLIRLKGTIRR